MADPARGYFALLLHAHLPFVRHPEHERFLEESWYFEALTETYLPLLWILEGMARDGTDFRISWSVSPTLTTMLGDELLAERYERHLRRLVELAEKEVVRQRGHAEFRATAEFYHKRYGLLLEYWLETCQRDLLGAFRRLQNEGFVEILACGATHGYLPILRHEPSSVYAQVRVSVDVYREAFGRDPNGFWLPECGYYPGVDEVLASCGVRYFCVESHGVLNGSARPKYGVFAPIVCPSGVAAFGRDPECSKQVWSKEEGFPGDPDYREFYHDIGFSLPLEYVAPYIGPDDIRTQTGIKYHRITGDTEDKRPYVRRAALEKAALHAGLFLQWRQQQVEWLAADSDRKPFIFAPYDAELFGHWWFEGPEWTNFLLRKMAHDQDVVRAATPSEYLAEYPECQVSVPSASSWGHEGFSEVWVNGNNDWLYPRLQRSAEMMTDMAFRHRGAHGLRKRALDQAGRELMLAQASDWAFILKTGTATGYARARVEEHLDNFERLAQHVESGKLNARLVAALEKKNSIFPHMSFDTFETPAIATIDAQPREPAHVAFLSAEMTPLVKVGGLADVVGALPSALAHTGVRVSVVLPAYGTIDRERFGLRPVRDGLTAPLGDAEHGFRLLEGDSPASGVRLYLVEHHEFFGRRSGVYVDPETKEEYPDTAERFAFFTRAALEGLRALGETVDVIHSHDHQTALASAFLKIFYHDDPVLGRAATVYTLHNLGYQGVYGPEALDLIGVDRDQFYPGSWFEHFGSVNWMKAGICFADMVSTVSESYAREICEDSVQSAALGGVLSARRDNLVGILNGIDAVEWDPATDPLIPAHFSAADLDGKAECKEALLEEAGLDANDLDTPLIGMITRLVDQKGLDLISAGIDRLLATGARLVVLGTGLPKYEEFVARVAEKHPEQVAALIRFDNGLAHRIEAGVDMFLMPSLYEPCGLNQMYSLRYGTVPIVRATGGLADTVTDADASEDGVGFTFEAYEVDELVATVERAVAAFGDAERWREIVVRAMRRNNSWDASAARYLDLYRAALVR